MAPAIVSHSLYAICHLIMECLSPHARLNFYFNHFVLLDVLLPFLFLLRFAFCRRYCTFLACLDLHCCYVALKWHAAVYCITSRSFVPVMVPLLTLLHCCQLPLSAT